MNFWNNPYKKKVVCFDLQSTTVNSNQRYYFDNQHNDFKDPNLKLVGFSVRVPGANKYTTKGKELMGADVHGGTFLNLLDQNEKPIMLFGFDELEWRTGGDNNFIRVNENHRIDLEHKKSFISVHATTALINAAAANNEQIEVHIWYRYDVIC